MRVRLYVLPNSDKAAAICHLSQLLCDEADIEKAINNRKFKGWLLQATQPKAQSTNTYTIKFWYKGDNKDQIIIVKRSR